MLPVSLIDLDLNSNNNGCHYEGSEEAVSSSQNGVENSTGSPSDWEGNTDILEMILVKDVAKGHEVSNLHLCLSSTILFFLLCDVDTNPFSHIVFHLV